ncbi:MAG: MFS transporter [Sneathiellales bacterium]|nr:MFS transporter [Sneathiellales bacterium]
MSFALNPQQRAIIAIIAAVTVMAVSLSLSIPLISISLERREVGSDIIGLMGALPALAFLFFSPVVPRLTRIFGTAQILWGGLALSSLSILALAFNDNLYLWFFLRLCMGTGMVILFLISETWLNEIAEDHNRGRTIALYISFMTAGFAFGPVLINILGSEGRLPFVISSIIIASGGLLFLFARGIFPTLSGKSRISVWSFIKTAPMICGAALLVAFFDGSVLTLLPIYGERNGMHVETAVLMSSVLLAGNLLLQFPIGWLADRFGKDIVILVCSIIGLGGALLLPFMVGKTIFLWPMLVLWGGAVVGTYTIALVIMGQVYKGAELVTANAATGVLWGVGSLIGPASAGYAMKIYDPHGMPAIFAIICFFFVLLSSFQFFKTKRRSTLSGSA